MAVELVEVAQTELQKKLGLRPGLHACVIYAPAGYASQFVPPLTTVDTPNEIWVEADWVQAFFTSQSDLLRSIDTLVVSIAKNGQLWISWPKKSSGVTSDLSDSIVRTIGLQAGLVDVKVAAIDSTWSALKFVYRLEDR